MLRNDAKNESGGWFGIGGKWGGGGSRNPSQLCVRRAFLLARALTRRLARGDM